MAKSVMPIDARRPSKAATQGRGGAEATNNAEHNPHANHILAYLTILTPYAANEMPYT